ncbi:DNA-binding transcriptional regulator FruR [Acetobacter orientalis]|uniref:DNA-binding transcriptional regulator FruR n=1 Tax=Acetobacter orientalis TaxID=146474 RepID=A0A2Z5ZEQ7_9PROT|nr:DNA-binding transcriptional regulator FruR [Acetobacter orientalis]
MCRPTAAAYLQKLITQHSTLTALISAALKRLQGFLPVLPQQAQPHTVLHIYSSVH